MNVVPVSPRRPFDVALSFAGEDREYAEALAVALVKRAVRVFYDRHEQATLWGKDLYTYFSDLYQTHAEFCVMFLSRHYAEKLWTNHERRAAQARAFQDRRDYILPIRLDDTEIPGILPTIGYLRWHAESLESITNALLSKLAQETNFYQFFFHYNAEPDPGIRRWYQIDSVRWIEEYPSGHTSTFVIVDQTTINDTWGFVARKVLGDRFFTLRGDYAFEVLIPSYEQWNPIMYSREKIDDQWQEWKLLAPVTYTKPAVRMEGTGFVDISDERE